MTIDLARSPFRGNEALASGQLTYRRLHGPGFVPLFRGVFVDASVEVDLRVRVQAVSLRAGPEAVVGGPIAALAWGADCPWEDAEAVLATDRRLAREGIRLRTDRLDPSEVAERFGVAVTTPVRTAFDLARRPGDLVEAVAAVDALAFRCRFGAAALREVIAHHPGVRGLVRARQVAELMEPLAESLPETRLRLAFVLRGLPAPVSQYPVRRPDGRWFRLDLAWPDAKVAVEYDGAEHRSAKRHADDLDRAAVLDDLGWDVVHVTARQLYRGPAVLAARVARKLALAAR